jgi:hypothetical protein
LNRFFPELTEEVRLYFQEDLATMHTASKSMPAISDTFGYLIPQISQKVIPVCGITSKKKCTNKISTYYTNMEKYLRRNI